MRQLKLDLITLTVYALFCVTTALVVTYIAWPILSIIGLMFS